MICDLGPAGLNPVIACLLVHFLWSCSVLESIAGLGFLSFEIDQGSFHIVEILLAGILEFVEDTGSICEDDNIGLGLG